MSASAKRSVLQMSVPVQLGVALAGVSVALGLRWIIDRGASGLEMATFFPIIVISALIMCWPVAGATAVLSVVSAVLFLRHGREATPFANAVLLATYLVTVSLIIATGQALQRVVRELQLQKEQAEQFNIELQHRVKNVLQIVKALASRAARTEDPVTFYRALEGRIDALAGANQLLGITRHKSGPLSMVIAAALEPFPSHFCVEGNDCHIRGDIAVTLTMVLHELATNALKYGALSREGGRVRLNWEAADGEALLNWREEGGPFVKPPERQGLGTRLLTSHGGLKHVNVDFNAAGLRCSIALPCEMTAG